MLEVIDGVFVGVIRGATLFCLMMFSPFARYPFRDLEDIPGYDGGPI
jgi:hypothetical protein